MILIYFKYMKHIIMCCSVSSYRLTTLFSTFLMFYLPSKIQLKQSLCKGHYHFYISHSEGFDLPHELNYFVLFINEQETKQNIQNPGNHFQIK